jgi:L-threonylcarbamoyladenylate synthase
MTIIFNKKSIIPEVTSAGLKSIGIRMPSNIIAREIIKSAGVPIAAPSANISGRPSPTDFQRCIDDLFGKIECIVEGQASEIGVESTIVDCTVKPPCVLRPGGITLEMLRTVDSDIYIDKAIMEKPKADLVAKAPGMKYRHYAPKAPLTIVKGDLKKTVAKINEIVQNYIGKGKKVGIMATDETKDQYKADVVISLGTREDIRSIGKNLFETLRCFDDKGMDVIISEAFDEKGFGVAIMNRLNKSAGFNIIDV